MILECVGWAVICLAPISLLVLLASIFKDKLSELCVERKKEKYMAIPVLPDSGALAGSRSPASVSLSLDSCSLFGTPHRHLCELSVFGVGCGTVLLPPGLSPREFEGVLKNRLLEAAKSRSEPGAALAPLVQHRPSRSHPGLERLVLLGVSLGLGTPRSIELSDTRLRQAAELLIVMHVAGEYCAQQTARMIFGSKE